MPAMEILKTMMSLIGDDGSKIYTCDTIAYEGKMWLVPEWLDNPLGGWRIPARIICLDPLPHQRIHSLNRPADFVLNSGIPKSVFYGETQPQPEDEFVIRERPDIRFPAIGG